MTASGTSGHGTELADYGDLSRLGAVVVKSLSVDPWPGNPAPRVHEVGAGMLNSVGLQGPGLAAWMAEDLPALATAGARVVVSIWGRTEADFGRAAELVAATAATDAGACIAALEVNVSCPNVEDRSRMFAHSAEATARVMADTACGLPRWAKLSPNVPDVVEIATGALEGGADGLTLVNTLLGLALDLETGRPVLGAGGGGLSGAPVHPVAVRAVWECRAAFPTRRSWGSGGCSRVATRWSCWWPGPTRSRWAPPPSGTRGRRGGCCASWRAGAGTSGRPWPTSEPTSEGAPRRSPQQPTDVTPPTPRHRHRQSQRHRRNCAHRTTRERRTSWVTRSASASPPRSAPRGRCARGSTRLPRCFVRGACPTTPPGCARSARRASRRSPAPSA